MGSSSSVPIEPIKPMELIKVIMVGLDASGKYTVLQKLAHHRDGSIEDNIIPNIQCLINDHYNYTKSKRVECTVPSSGFHVQTLKIQLEKQLEINSWDLDVGDSDNVSPLWRNYYKGVKALVFVVDSNDWDRIDSARHEMHRLMNEDELKNTPLLVLANKRDLPGVMNLSGMKESLGMYPFSGIRRRWRVHGICASQDLGICEGFEWIISGCPDLLKPTYDIQLLRSLCSRGRASIKKTQGNNWDTIENILSFLCNQPPEICEMVEIYLGVIDKRVTGLEFSF